MNKTLIEFFVLKTGQIITRDELNLKDPLERQRMLAMMTLGNPKEYTDLRSELWLSSERELILIGTLSNGKIVSRILPI